MSRTIPTSRTISRYVKDLGKPAWREYRNLREKYKEQGLTAREAYERAFIELKIEARHREWKYRVGMQEALESEVPLTPAELSEVSGGSQVLRVSRAESIGQQEMSLPEQVKWAMRWAAKVQNGEEPPVSFPNEGALFWYQSAVGNRREFEKLLLRVEAPGGDSDNLFLQDSQYQYSEMEKQLKQVLQEVGPKLRELEKEWFEEQKSEAG